MAEPKSIKIEPWCDFPRQSYSFITDDFCHEKQFVAKIAAKTSRSVIKIKESLTCKSGTCNVADEVKLWFDLPNGRSIYTKVKSNDYIKILYDHGTKQINNKKVTFYGALNTNKLLNRVAIKAGVLHDSEHCHSDNRLKLTLQQKQNDWHWYHRTTVNHNNYLFGVLGVLDISKKVLQKNALMFGYRKDENNEFFLRTDVRGYRKTAPELNAVNALFDYVLADYIKRIDSQNRVGIQAGFDLKTNTLSSANLVYERIIKKGQVAKLGINKDLDISFMYKRPVYGLEDIAKLSMGLGVSNIQKGDAKVRTGFELGLNI